VCDVLLKTMARFATLEASLEVGHCCDMLVNESLNNTVSWVAPKNKTCSASQSLDNQISVAVGVNGLGMCSYFCCLFQQLHIQMTDDVRHCLQQINVRRTCPINTSCEVK